MRKTRAFIKGDPEILEIENNLRLFKEYDDDNRPKKLTEDILTEMHDILYLGLLDKDKQDDDFVEQQQYTQEFILPLKLMEKIDELDKFMSMFNIEPASFTEAYKTAAVLSAYFEGISFFPKGNDKMARFLYSFYFYQHGFSKTPNIYLSRTLFNLGGNVRNLEAQARA
jgi:Fic family protein